VAGHVGLELRNVGANYPFEKSHRFAGIQPNSSHRDHSRLSCSVAATQLGLVCPHGRWSIAEMARIAAHEGPKRDFIAVADTYTVIGSRPDARPRRPQTAFAWRPRSSPFPSCCRVP
jgi:hypothetical protein